MHFFRKAGVGLASLVVLGLAAAPHACAQGFTGYYAPEHWTTTTGPGGSVTATAVSSTLVSPDGDPFRDRFDPTRWSIAASADGVVTYDWVFTGDAFTGVPSGYFVGDTDTALTGFDDFAGAVGLAQTFSVTQGETFGFFVETLNGEAFNRGTLTVSNFRFTSNNNTPAASTPEPSQTAAFGLGVLGLSGLMLKARKRKASAAV